MPRTILAPARSQFWRLFSPRHGRRIERAARAGETPACPFCDEPLQEDGESRLRPVLILDATAYELVCTECRRFWCVVQHTPRSLRLMRMRRLAAAVRAIEPALPAVELQR